MNIRHDAILQTNPGHHTDILYEMLKSNYLFRKVKNSYITINVTFHVCIHYFLE